MKILILAPKLEPSFDGVYVGGYVNSLRLLLLKYKDDGIHFEILTSSCDTKADILRETFIKDISIHIIKNNYRPQSVSFGIKFLFGSIIKSLKLRNQNFDIVHGHSGFAIYSICTYIVSKILKSMSVHSLYCPIETNVKLSDSVILKIKNKLHSKTSSLILNALDKIIVMSKNVKHSLINVGVKKEIIIASPLIDFSKFNQNNNHSVRNSLGIKANDIVILYVGNLKLSKGLDLLIDSLAKIFSTHANVKLVITLEHKDRGFEKKLNNLLKQTHIVKHKDKIIILGIINFMAELIYTANILVVPFRDTQGPSDYPVVIIEKMASGGGVVLATDVGGIPELISDGQTGKLINANDVDSIHEAIIDLISSPNKSAEIANNARIFIENNFSEISILKKYYEVYNLHQNDMMEK